MVWPLTGTVWKVAELEGQMVGAEKIPTLQLEPDGSHVAAFGGVNHATGMYTLKDDTLTFSPLAATRMAGPPVQMAVEDHFLAMLGKVDHYRIKGPWLILLTGDQIVARAQATPAKPFAPTESK